MKKFYVSAIKMVLYLLVIFASMRIVFIVNYWQLITFDKVPITELLKIIWKALPLDISTACYFMAIPTLVLYASYVFKKMTPIRILRYYFYLIIAAYILIVVGEIGIYDEWRTKLSYKALAYLKNPSEVINTASTGATVYLVATWACFTALFSWWYVRWIEPKEDAELSNSSILAYAVSLAAAVGLIFIGLRGGVNEIPISTSSGYFSKYKIVNIINVNPAYNLAENTLNSKKMDNFAHFNYMDAETAKRRTDAVNSVECDSTFSILKTRNPNVVVVLLESWSADLIESLGGEPDITPNFHELEKEGLLFTNFYASANRSQQAIASIFGGLPGLPVTTITNHQDKYYAIPSLPKILDTLGYHTSFYFGGELNYGNILSYLRYNEFGLIVEGKDIVGSFPRGKLGIQDTGLLPWYAKQLQAHPQPFFSTVFTLSSHSPYDYPKIFDELEWPQMHKEFVNSGHYTDIALKLFMEEARRQPWYDNTLFIFLADHSNPSHKNHPLESFEFHKIPMLILGEPLNDSLKGTTYDAICGNTDFPSTLLAQLGVGHENFYWSKDVFNYCYKPSAFFELNEGLGWKTPEGEYVISGNDVIVNTLPAAVGDSISLDGKAYMQHHFNLFNSY